MGPADPYNCEDGFANWQAGWSVAKKEWCCRVHGKGCPNQGGGCATVAPTAAPIAEPYDCEAGFANWMAGWSVAKKAWCCSNKGKGCPPAAGGCAREPRCGLRRIASKPCRPTTESCSAGLWAIFPRAASAALEDWVDGQVTLKCWHSRHSL